MKRARALRLMGIVCVGFGIGMLFISILTGSSEIFLIAIIPVIRGEGLLSVSGMALMVLGFVIFTFAPLYHPFSGKRTQRMARGEEGTIRGYEQDKVGKGKMDVGGAVFLGPIPIIFGSNRTTGKWMMIMIMMAGLIISLIVATIFVLSII